jgi:serine/threonine protein kinase
VYFFAADLFPCMIIAQLLSIHINCDCNSNLAELKIGRVLGKGRFSVVSEIQGVKLDDVYDTSDEEAKLRQGFAEQVQDGSGISHSQRQFVVKMLRTDLPEEEHTKGVVDLAIEAEFLKTLRHANIITMRAHANSDPHESRFFVILEKLVITLERKMNFWRQEVTENVGFWFPCFGYCCAKQHVLHRLWMERLMVSRDISMAIRYLHTQGIVYRDLVRVKIARLDAAFCVPSLQVADKLLVIFSFCVVTETR